MNYPIWELTYFGGASFIAFISIFHTYVAHLAVGGGLYLLLSDMKVSRENKIELYRYQKSHTKFFLLLTMVFGGVTGVGIWFIIALVNPAGTSALIHNFVFGWAIEWVFFLGEIAALLIYYYKFEYLEEKHRQLMAFFYFIFAWLSLAVINGILSFMLTPGSWVETRNFWDGFLNPSYLPSLVFRTFMSFLIAGLFGFLTAVFNKNELIRNTFIPFNRKWLYYPVAGLILFGLIYYFVIPENIRVTAFGLNKDTSVWVNVFFYSSALIFILGLFVSTRGSQLFQKTLVLVLVTIGLTWLGGFEYIRENARRPFVINQYMYSSSILKSDLPDLKKSGFVSKAKWVEYNEINNENIAEVGHDIFNAQCLACHTINGIRNDLIPLVDHLTYEGLVWQVSGQGKILNYMPPFAGNEKEIRALATYIYKDLLGKIPEDKFKHEIDKNKVDIPKFDEKSDDYVLLAWNDLGMHCISDSDPWWVILPPANTIEAQLIKRGKKPEIITEGIKIEYSVEKGFENPSKEVPFWDWEHKIFGKELEENIGLAGNGMRGNLHFDHNTNGFIAHAIPVVPYREDGFYNPYPLFEVKAIDEKTGEILVETKLVTPTSTEMGCKNCHQGDWKKDGVSGVSDVTAMNVLEIHDLRSGTNLLEEAKAGNPVMCQSCHEDPAVGSKGDGIRRSLSTALHAWHANYLTEEDGSACVRCHPADNEGNTRCSRGVHNSLGMDCADCHGNIQEHAAALLKNEIHKPGSQQLLKNLEVKAVKSFDEIIPRTSWLNEPDCLNCHEDFNQPKEDYSSYNKWACSFNNLYRIRTDNAGVRCEACHGSTHALYPAKNPYQENRDNIQPLQYQNSPLPIGANENCQVCHTQKMEYNFHHKNMVRSFRNTQLIN